MDQNWAISFVRTVVAPLLVGAVGQSALYFWSDDVSLMLRVITASLIGAAWYVVARLAQIWKPNLGFMLIVAARPRYDDEDRDAGLLVSVVRTVVPLAVATTLGCLVAATLGGSAPALSLVAVVIYYGSLRWVEENAALDSFARNVAGWMLGARAVPHY